MVRATLSADNPNITLAQDEEDLIIETIDFATVTNANTKFTFTAMSQDQTDLATQITTVDTNHSGNTDR